MLRWLSLLVLVVPGLTWANPPFPVVTTNSMQWTNPSTNTDGTPASLQGTNVYRAAACAGPFTPYQGVTTPGSSFTDTTPLAGGNCYQVTAVGTNGKESAPSNALGFPVPSAPAGLH